MNAPVAGRAIERCIPRVLGRPWLGVRRAAVLVVGLAVACWAGGWAGAATAGGEAGAGNGSSVAHDPIYAALRAARPDGRAVEVHGLAFDRDVFHFELQSGTLYFLAPAGGRTFGAVFLGHGTLRLSPATPVERRQLALEVGAGGDFEVLTDSFEELVLLFGDDSERELTLAAGPVRTGAPDPRATQVYERWLDRQKNDFHLNLQLRVLRDLLNHPGASRGAFLALLAGKTLPPALVAVDPEGAGSLVGGLRLGGESSLLYVPDPHRGGIWYLSGPRGGGVPARPEMARALHYWVATSVPRGVDLGGVTTIRLKALAPGLRVLPIQLMPRLRIAEASYGPAPAAAPKSGTAAAPPKANAAPSPSPAPPPGDTEPEPAPDKVRAAAVVQEDAKEDGGDAAVVFPEPLAEGEEVLLRLAYHGDAVLRDAGDKNYVVEARDSWYPNLGTFAEPAPFDLVYRVPAGNQVVSVGRLVATRTLGSQVESTWKTDGPVRVAGFNYGQFKEVKQHDETSGIDLQVFTNPGTPDIIRTINEIMESSGSREMSGLGIDGEFNAAPAQTLGRVNTGRLAEAAMADGINACRVFSIYFGPLAEKHVAITQQSQFTFGQSWPSLIFMPYISFLDSTQRQRLGLVGSKDFVDKVGFHEMSHQWWAHLVNAATYHDVWMEEGFAEFSAALAVQHTQGWGAYLRFWREARKEIFARPPHSAITNVEAGPITQGFRVTTERSPYAYRAVVYEKGAYVLHMLRMLMWDGADATPDRRFIAMMHDYAASYAGKEASTADFQEVVERHMVPTMDAEGNGKMDWFFRQWVYGAEVPHYAADLHLESAGGEVHIKGKVTQEEVSDGFHALVPIYLEFDRGRFVRVGLLRMVGKATVPVDVTVKPPSKPRGVLLNARAEVLARD